MSSVQKNKKVKNIILLIVALVIFGAAGFFAYKNLMPGNSRSLLVVEEDMPGPGEPSVDYSTISDLDILIRQFEKYGNWPERPGKEGKANPFLPYFGD